jgi:uncharacterized pyridoxamine 5'-phosphate oxidase family protein
MTLIETINKIDNKSTIYIYPNITKYGGYYELEILDQSKITKIKSMLKKEKCIYEYYAENETFYKNLVKITKIYENKESVDYYEIEPSEYVINDKNLILFHKVQKIKREEFPSLTEYDRIDEKNTEVYIFDSLFGIIFETQNNQTIIKIKLISNTNLNTLDKIIMLLTKI